MRLDGRQQLKRRRPKVQPFSLPSGFKCFANVCCCRCWQKLKTRAVSHLCTQMLRSLSLVVVVAVVVFNVRSIELGLAGAETTTAAAAATQTSNSSSIQCYSHTHTHSFCLCCWPTSGKQAHEVKKKQQQQQQQDTLM